VEVASKLSVRSDNVSLVAKIENIDNVGVFGAEAGRALHAGIVNELPLAVEVVPFLLHSVDDNEALVCRPHVGWPFFDHLPVEAGGIVILAELEGRIASVEDSFGVLRMLLEVVTEELLRGFKISVHQRLFTEGEWVGT